MNNVEYQSKCIIKVYDIFIVKNKENITFLLKM